MATFLAGRCVADYPEKKLSVIRLLGQLWLVTGFSGLAASGCVSDLPDTGAYDHPDTRV